MKHNVQVTLLLVVFFVVAQLVGLGLVLADADVVVNEDNETIVVHPDTVLGERPDLEGGSSFVTIVIALAIGTLLALVLMKFQALTIWKVWFFLAVFFSIAIALGTILPALWAYVIAFVLAALKLFRNNTFVHNLSELLIYPGIVILFVPLLDIWWGIALLLAISAYDMYAVWKSKHMISMATFQSKSKTFAGLHIPYTKKGIVLGGKVKKGKPTVKRKVLNAILGGGDIAFPLLFSGVVLEMLLVQGMTGMEAYLRTLWVTLGATVALSILFVKGRKDRFYPAMPFLTLGCLVGYALLQLTL